MYSHFMRTQTLPSDHTQRARPHCNDLRGCDDFAACVDFVACDNFDA